MSNKKLAMVVLAVFAAVCIVGLVALHVVWQVVFGPTPGISKGRGLAGIKTEKIHPNAQPDGAGGRADV